MNNTSVFYTWIEIEAIIFLSYIIICAALTKSRFTAKKNTIIILSATVLSVILNTSIFFLCHNVALSIRMLPLTAYLPVIIVLHLLSDSGFFKTVPIWCIGLFGTYAGHFSIKAIVTTLSNTNMEWYIRYGIELLILLAVMSIICIVTVKFLRKPFNRYIRCSDTNWSVPLVLALLLIAMFSYFYNSPYDIVVVFLLFLIAITTFLIIVRLIRTEYVKQQLTKEHDEYEILIRIQQKEFMEIARKHEQLREYRHDMRHHLLALDNILCNSDNTHAKEYINSLVERLEDTENIRYCKNQTINAVLSSYITKAKKLGCALETHIAIPEKLNIEDLDLCIVLSNALENAINACEKTEANQRYIKIKINFHNVLRISIKNNCNEAVSFDKNGLPITAPRPGHGIGIKSIVNTIEKYDGIFKCEYAKGEFSLNILMFNAVKAEQTPYTLKTPKPVWSTIFLMFGIGVFLNLSPKITEVLADMPIVNSVVQVITANHHQSGWGQNKFDVEIPNVMMEQSIQEQNALITSTKGTAAVSAVAGSSRFDTDANKAAAKISSDKISMPSAGAADTEVSAPSAGAVDTEVSAPSAEASDSKSPALSSGKPSANETPESKVSEDSDTWNIQQEIIASIADNNTGYFLPLPVCENVITENPKLENGIEKINNEMNDYIELLRQKYYWYLNHNYMGYVAMDTTYSILCNNDNMLSIRFDSTLNTGGSGTFSRCFTLDKRTGNVVELEDLFQDGADYITPISSYILEQMIMEVKNGSASYFVPGGIWSEEECFKSISEEQNFYLNTQGKLVITFDEYEVAPGKMGVVEFVIPTDTIHTILSDASLIQ